MRTDTGAFSKLLALELTPENRRVIETDVFDAFGSANFREVFALLDLVLEQDESAAAAINAEETDRLFLDSLLDLVRRCPLRAGWAAAPPAGSRIQSVGEAYDFFFGVRDEMEWSLLRCLNFLYRSKIKPRRKLAIVTAARNEGVNIVEWIAHHRLFGVEDFFIYVNDNDDRSSGLLSLLAGYGVIHLIWNDTGVTRDGGNVFPIQAKAFGHATQFLRETLDFEWLLFTDMDEFLVTRPVMETPAAERPADDLFARLEAMPEPPAAVAFNWKWFNSQCAFGRTPGLNFERFHHIMPDQHVKTMARRSRPLSFSTSHMPRLPAGDIVLDGALQPAVPDFRMPTAYGYGQLNHYWHKSFEEYVAKYLRVWGNRKFGEFFHFGGNLQHCETEEMPGEWIGRLQQEISRLRALPGVEAECRRTEAAFGEMIAAFDRQHDMTAEFHRHLEAVKNG